MTITRIFAAAVAALGFVSVASAGVPAANLLSAPLVAPSTAWSDYDPSTYHTPGIAAWPAGTLPPEISALARTLGADRLLSGQMTDLDYTRNVFDYVRNNIETEFRFGLSKGGRGALIDQSGTAFDQAELMVKLLGAGGVGASYKLGTIQLSASDFGKWTGLFQSLTEGAQIVTVNAAAACRLIADGGIPGSCSPSTGNLSTITMGHIWVAANGNLYDPSYKTSTLYNGVDVPAALGCGTSSAPTCGPAMVDAAMVGASSGNTVINGETLPYVQYLNNDQLHQYLNNQAVNLQSNLQTNNRLARVEQVVSGKRLMPSPTPAIGDTLSYVTGTQATWTEGIPDAYRTTLRLRTAFAYAQTNGTSSSSTIDRTFYADEIAGRRLQVVGLPGRALLVDSIVLPENSCGGLCPQFEVLLDVSHPYPTPGYGDSSIALTMGHQVPMYGPSPFSGVLPVTVIHGWGNSGLSTERHYTALQDILPAYARTYWQTYDDGLTTHNDNEVANRDQPLIGVRALVTGSVADRLIAGIARSAITRHHTVGIVYGHPHDPSYLSYISMHSGMSVVSATNDAVARTAAFETSAATFATLEGSANHQLNHGYPGLSTATTFSLANSTTPGVTRYKYVQRTSPTGLVLFTEDNSAAITVSSDSIAHTIQGGMKGGTAISNDPVTKAMESVRLADAAADRKKYLSISEATGTLRLTHTDIVTGVGDFPHSLPFRRTYSSDIAVTDETYTHFTDTFTPANESQSTSQTYSRHYAGPDSSATAKIGGGWNHNYNVLASYTGNAAKGLGQDYGIEAAASIAALRNVYSAARAPSLAGRVSSMLALSWLAKSQWAYNAVVVDKGGQTEIFHRLPDGQFFSAGNSAKLVQQGSVGLDADFAPVTFVYTGAAGDTIDFDVARYSKYAICCNATTRGDPVFKANHWTFPDGTVVTFNYGFTSIVVSGDGRRYTACDNQHYCPPGQMALPFGYVLGSVTNNLGRRLTITSTSTQMQVLRATTGIYPTPVDSASRFTITRVTDETGREVQYHLGGCNGKSWVCNQLLVRGPDDASTVFQYGADVSSPDPSGPVSGSSYRLRRWYTPSDQTNPYYTFVYDETLRVKLVRDALGNVATYYPGSVVGSERWKRAEIVSPLGAVTVNIFDDYNNLLSSIDPVGGVTTTTYDAANRPVRTTYPEGNSIEKAYDVRSNVVSTTKRAKPGSNYINLLASTTYGEGPSVLSCTNPRTCNQPATVTDFGEHITSYTYSPTTGQLLTIAGQAVPLGASTGTPLTTLCYTPYNSISFLSGRIERMTATTNRVTTYSYNASNKYVLASSTTDPSTTLTPPAAGSLSCPTTSKSGALNLVTALTFDAVGNPASVDGPVTGTADTTTYAFDAVRRITRISAPLGMTTRYCYDGDGLVVGTHKARIAGASDPNAATATTDGRCSTGYSASDWQSEGRTYWQTGDLRSVQDAEGNITRFAYDEDGRLRVQQDPDGRQVASVYDLAGRTIATWRGGQSWIDAYGDPAVGTPDESSSWDPATYVNAGNDGPLRYAKYTYSANGQRTSVYDANNNITAYHYDGFDRMAFTAFPHPISNSRCAIPSIVTPSTIPNCTTGQTYEKSTYDGDGNRRTLRTRKGDTLTWTYDAAHRQRTKDVSGTPALAQVTYGYNLIGLPLSASSPAIGTIPAHSVAFDYDGAGRKLYEDNLLNGVVRRTSFQYTQDGQRQRTTWPDAYFVHYTYDAAGRLEYARENSTSANEIARYQYDPLARRTELRFAGQTTNRINYTYELDGNLDVLTNVLNTVTVTLNHGHNASGQINSIVANDDFYLPSPAVSSTSYSVDRQNRYGSIGGTAPTYDLNGNLLTWVLNGVEQTYTYDPENRLRTAATDGTTTASIVYDYDALGRRISKTVGGATTFYQLDGDEEIADIGQGGAVERRYLMGPAIDDRIARAEGSATTNPPKSYYHVNHQGSVIATAQANGTIVQQISYDEYGKSTAAATGEPFRYTGRRFDQETDLYYYRARYYSPALGRFLQTDPVGYDDDFNLYAYVGNDPVNRIDPSGQNAAVIETVITTGSRAASLTPWAFIVNIIIPTSTASKEQDQIYILPYAAYNEVNDRSDDSAAEGKDDGEGAQEEGEGGVEETPATHPKGFRSVRGKKGKESIETGEIWEKDNLHKDHYEVYKNRKLYDKGVRDRDVWADGRPKRKF